MAPTRRRAIIDDTTDDARPDQEESELLFGESIAWMRPNAPLVRPQPQADSPPEPEESAPSVAVDAAAPVADALWIAPIAAQDSAGAESRETPSNGRRNLLIAAACAAAVLLVVVAVVALSGGGDDKADVAAGGGAATTTTAPPTTAAPNTIPPSEGTEKTTAAGTSVTVNADVLFDVNSAELTPVASSRLGGFLTLARRDAKRMLLIEGFTDSDGDPTFNQQLSEARAQSVAQWLSEQGIDPARISVVGHGADNPVSPNDTAEHKALNRRVVVTLQLANS